MKAKLAIVAALCLVVVGTAKSTPVQRGCEPHRYYVKPPHPVYYNGCFPRG